MVEVIKSNFDEKFEEIESAIRRCDFVALDTEFTGLRLNEGLKSSLFDDGAARYRKLRETVSQITICQLGLSVFTRDQTQTSKPFSVYEAKTYNFYLCPRSFGPVDDSFTCQASSLQFLNTYSFDFNKWIREGISFLNDDQEFQIRQHVASKAMFTGLERDVDETVIQKICSRVADWLVNSKDEVFSIQQSEMERIPMYVLSMELRGRFPSIWTVINNKEVQVTRMDTEERVVKEQQEKDSQKEHEENLMLKMLGFTRLFRVMKQCKKPLLGHNMLMDLMLVYDKFHKPLPSSYVDFKSNFHVMFPKVFDTKHICLRIRWSYEHTGLLQYTSLGDVYRDLKSDAGRDLVIYPPQISHADDSSVYDEAYLPHEAGFDAYMTGFVFLRLAHILTFKETKSTEVIPCIFRRYLQTMQPYCNNINMIRAKVNNISLEGNDHNTQKPELLYVRSRLFKQKLNIDQLAKWFSSYGSVDVKPFNTDKALVAASNFTCAKDILKAFKGHNSIYITQYNMWRHSPFVRGLLWSGVAVSGVVSILALLSTSKKD